MRHVGSLPDDDCCKATQDDPARCCHQASCEPAGVHSLDSLESDLAKDRSPVQVARADAAHFRSESPFVLHAGQMLFVVTEDEDSWVVAEMRFDPEACLFAEARISRFAWPREAFGRLMSRAVVGELIDEDSADRVTRGFTGWLAAQFVA